MTARCVYDSNCKLAHEHVHCSNCRAPMREGPIAQHEFRDGAGRVVETQPCRSEWCDTPGCSPGYPRGMYPVGPRVKVQP